MGTTVPLLNDYKKQFLWKRLPQTILGGAKFKLDVCAPFFVYTNQIILLVFPLILGGIFTLIIEFAGLPFDIGCYIYGVLMFIFVLIVQITSFIRTRRRGVVSPRGETKHNILNDDDDDLDFESCCDRETVNFVSPTKALGLIPIHAVLSGLISGAGLWFLLPSVVWTLGTHDVITGLLVAFGWLTMCMGLYSLTLTSPPELAQYRALLRWDILPSRPVHMAVFIVLHIVAVSVTGTTYLATLNVIGHVVFAILPVLWLTGVLPPTEALLLYVVEQWHVLVMAGSPMASTPRILITFIISTLTLVIFLAVWIQPIIIFLSIAGLILSLDWSGLITIIWHKLRKKSSYKSSISWTFRGMEWTLYIVMLGLTIACSIVGNLYHSDIYPYAYYVGYAVFDLTVLDYVLCSVQRVYIFGLFRNPLYPKDANLAADFRKKKKCLHGVGVVRTILFNAVCPVLLLVYVVVMVSQRYHQTGVHDLWDVLLIARATRLIWQSTSESLQDVSIHVLINIFLNWDASLIPVYPQLSPALQLFYISLLRDKTRLFLNKLYTYMVILVNSWYDKKQRRKSTIVTIVLNLVLFPLVLTVLMVATLLSAPLLPLFTLPVVWFAFPRPGKFWPSRVGKSASSCADSVVYREVAPALVKTLNRAIGSGALDCRSDSQYLLRYQDRMLWITVLERGYTYITINIKGLELQETSCHTIEATRIDDIFQLAFETEKRKCCDINRNFFNTLTPKTADLVQTYSDAKNVLTGIIDSPDNLERVRKDFPNVLCWVLIKHVIKNSDRIPGSESPIIGFKGEKSTLGEDRTLGPKVSGAKLPPLNHTTVNTVSAPPMAPVQKTPAPLARIAPLAPLNPRSPSPLEKVESPKTKLKSREVDDLDLEELLDDWDDDSRPNTPVKTSDNLIKVKPKTVEMPRMRTRTASPVPSEAESVWSTDSDHVPLRQMKPKPNVMAGTSNRMGEIAVLNSEDSFSPVRGLKTFNLMPAADIGSSLGDPLTRPGNSKFGTNLALDAKFKSLVSLNYKLPDSWLDVPVDKMKLTNLTKNFAYDWLKMALRILARKADVSGNHVTEIVSDDEYCRVVAQLVAVCQWALYEAGSPSSTAATLGPGHVYKCFVGDFPYSASSDWLDTNPDLKRLVTVAYRYTVKLMIDQAIVGEVSDLDELAEYLTEYDSDWFIGFETDADWPEQIMNGRKNLMSIARSAYQGTYSSRTLSKQSLPIYTGTLNSDLVKAQWANLSLELLYMTNDDEERYSIQAHPAILRNLTVQAADPPLGYPIYSSEPINVPTL